MRLLLCLWAAGALCRFLAHAGNCLWFSRMVRRCPVYIRNDAQAVLERVNEELGRKKRFEILLVCGIRAPAVFGLLHPKILMPDADYPKEEFFDILKHEMLHYYRHDMVKKLFCELLCTVFWWNPLAYLLRQFVTHAIEIGVDRELTAGFGEEEKIRYMECIVRSMKAERAGKRAFGIPLFSRRGNFMKRRFARIWEGDTKIGSTKRGSAKMSGARTDGVRVRGRAAGGGFPGPVRVRSSVAWKMLLRAPVRTALTFLLVVAASFSLFSRVTDYAVTSREAQNAESFYHGVAALDLTTPAVMYDDGEWGYMFNAGNKPWPKKEKMEEFSSLPGVTVADHRYMTAGMVEDYKRMEGAGSSAQYVLEGTYEGYEESPDGGNIKLLLDDVKVLAGDLTANPEETLKLETYRWDDEEYELRLGQGFAYGTLPVSFYDGLAKGSRCLALAACDATTGNVLSLQLLDPSNPDKPAFYVVDGLGEDYLDTEEFAYLKNWVEGVQKDMYTYDIVYTSDMRAIPRFNERKMVVNEGRPLVTGDEDVCVVSEEFLSRHQLSVGDEIDVKLGDQLRNQSYANGALSRGRRENSDFIADARLRIVGSYCFMDDDSARTQEQEWAYTINTVFVPSSLLPVEVPDDYVADTGEFSVLVEDARDIEKFREAAEPMAAELGLGLRFSDGGWLGIQDSFERGRRTALLTAVLYAAASALALLLAVYLYIGRSRKPYAIMRTLGAPTKRAGNAVVLPFAVLSAVAIPLGGAAGILYTSREMARALADLTDGAPQEYVLDVRPSAWTVALCLAAELAFLVVVALLFLRKMHKTPPLELLSEGSSRKQEEKTAVQESAEPAFAFAGADVGKLHPAGEMELSSGRRYGAFRQVSAYLLRHMRRGYGKTAVSLALAAVLATGVGAFALARLNYRDAFHRTEVKGSAAGFASSSLSELADSGLADNIYYYGKMSLCVNSDGVPEPVTFTNDLDRCLTGDYEVEYAEECKNFNLEVDGSMCVVGKSLAQIYGIQPGDEIHLMTYDLYNFISDLYDDEAEFQKAVERAGKPYKVAGILDSGDAVNDAGIFMAANSAAEALYGQPFSVGYCEFTLADNDRLKELNAFLEEQKEEGMKYAQTASFYIDSAGLENVGRIRDMIEALFPVAVAAAALIGLIGSALVILQSAREAAFLRILGVTKKRARCMLAAEQAVLCVAGIILVAGGLLLYSPGLFVRSRETLGLCYALYFLASVCGACAAAVQVTKGRILELLQGKE